jgi:hypothetical protein
MDTEIIKLANNQTMELFRHKQASGINMLLKEGFKPTDNHAYYRKDNIIAHYNSLIKAWIIEQA